MNIIIYYANTGPLILRILLRFLSFIFSFAYIIEQIRIVLKKLKTICEFSSPV